MTNANDCWSPRYPDEDELARAVEGSAALRQLLAAASGPPSRGELRGRARAIADFRAAQRLRAATGKPDTEPPQGAHRGKLSGLRHPGRWPTPLAVACAALLVLVEGFATATATATAAVGGLPPPLRNALFDLATFWRRLPVLARRTSALPTPRAGARCHRSGTGPLVYCLAPRHGR